MEFFLIIFTHFIMDLYHKLVSSLMGEIFNTSASYSY